MGAAEVWKALPLAQLSDRSVSAEDWGAYIGDWPCQGASRPVRRGWLSASSPRGAILGVAPWWTQPTLGGEALWSGPPWVCEPGARSLVAEALRAELLLLARSMNCARAYFVGDACVEKVQP